eukprot:scpid39530/ scgid24197/ 
MTLRRAAQHNTDNSSSRRGTFTCTVHYYGNRCVIDSGGLDSAATLSHTLSLPRPLLQESELREEKSQEAFESQGTGSREAVLFRTQSTYLAFLSSGSMHAVQVLLVYYGIRVGLLSVRLQLLVLANLLAGLDLSQNCNTTQVCTVLGKSYCQ